MTEEQATLAFALVTKLALTKKLMQNECRADIPNEYINSIRQLVATDENVRTSFYKVMRALGEKYDKQYMSEINNL